jgi:hypothetical protein
LAKEQSDSDFFKRLFDGYYDNNIRKNENQSDFENWLDDNDDGVTFKESFDISRKEKARKRFKKRMKKD